MRVTRRDALRGAVATAVGAIAGASAYGVAYERHHIVRTDASLPVSGLAPAHDGLRIAFLSDIHHSALVPAADVSAAVQVAMRARADLIVLGGDYVTYGDRAFVGPVAELLQPLSAPHGVFAILGNHDDDRDMPAALARHGVTVLKDQRTTIDVRGEPFEIAGIRFWTRSSREIARVLDGRPVNLLLAHDPRRLDVAAALNIPAVLSGHTHGGQIVIPGFGAVAKTRFPVLAGLGQRDNTRLFVTRGIGTVYLPARINCPPEVAVITLRRLSSI
jgi:predicted MPP superfamily phosphohydrolase